MAIIIHGAASCLQANARVLIIQRCVVTHAVGIMVRAPPPSPPSHGVTICQLASVTVLITKPCVVKHAAGIMVTVRSFSDWIRTGLCPPFSLENRAPIGWAGSFMSMFAEAIGVLRFCFAMGMGGQIPALSSQTLLYR